MKRTSEHLTGDIDEVVLQAVYGNSRMPPGDERSPGYKLLRKFKVGDENESEGLAGIWAPPNRFAKAMAMKSLFQNLTGPYRFPDYVATPLYVAVGYDAFKTRDVMEVVARYPDHVLAYGFFTSDVPPEAKLIAKTVEEFEERTTPTTYEEKLFLQLAKTDPECVMSFCELGPSYMSADCDAGEIDCSYLFPPGYSSRGEQEVHEVKKKTKKRGGRTRAANAAAAAHVTAEETTSVATSDLNKEQSELDHEEVGELESDEEAAGAPEDKATSPIADGE